jgi:alkylation response protein AidB-like acyl-CoA dehydrogenase
MQHYQSNLRDIYFNLFEFLKIQDTTLQSEVFKNIDQELTKDLLQGMKVLAEGEYSAGFASADQEGLKLLDDGVVQIPQGVKRSLSAYYKGEWQRLTAPEELGGYGVPPSVYWACFEMIVGAHAAAAFYSLGEVNAQVIYRLGTEKQKELFSQNIIEKHWGGTMMLTEPDAGSDVGSGLSKARHVEGEVWELEGVKRYITNGDYDHCENIIHLVLARPEGGVAGTRGLSMFIVPKFWVNEDGSLGERNGVYVSSIEEKMGLHASATCEMTLGDKHPCRGYLVGNVHRGMRQMFQVIEHARMAVGFKSFSTLSTAYLNALSYSKERIQGADLMQATDKNAPRVAIINHPDVRRMLLKQKSYVEGMRALGLYNAHVQDQIMTLGGHGHQEAQHLDRLNDLLLPLIKGYCSEKVYEILGSCSLQCFGGAGYVRDYPVEQYVRDQKIDTLYEGTTHIQALDLLFRKVAKDGGKTLQTLFKKIQSTVDGEQGGEVCDIMRTALDRGLKDVQGIFLHMMQKMGVSLYHVGLQGNRILASLSELVIGWLLVEQAVIASEKLEQSQGKDLEFYQGKVACAQFFTSQVLPGLTLNRKLVEASDLSIMDMNNQCF